MMLAETTETTAPAPMQSVAVRPAVVQPAGDLGRMRSQDELNLE